MPRKNKKKQKKMKTKPITNVNTNKVITSRQRPNLREVRRALPGSKALQGYSVYGIPELKSQSSVLTNNMLSQLNNFKNELETGQRALQAQQAAFEQRAQRQNAIAGNIRNIFGGAPNQTPPGAQANLNAQFQSPNAAFSPPQSNMS